MQIDVTRDVFQLAQVFTISRGSRTQAEVLTVTVSDAGVSGVGECVPYARYGETMDSVSDQVMAFSGDWARLPDELPAGAARNALDCALWDHAAKTAGKTSHKAGSTSFRAGVGFQATFANTSGVTDDRDQAPAFSRFNHSGNSRTTTVHHAIEVHLQECIPFLRITFPEWAAGECTRISTCIPGIVHQDIDSPKFT